MTFGTCEPGRAVADCPQIAQPAGAAKETPMDSYEGVRLVHIFAGTVALVAFWTNAALRKGSLAHRTVGRGYLVAMLCVTISAAPLAGAAFGRGEAVAGVFLSYLILITATACWVAWRAIRDQRSYARFTGATFQALAWLNLLAGAAILAVGIRYGQLILTAFAFVGIGAGVAMLRQLKRAPTERRWWLSEHYGAVIGCGVATHIAFLNLGLSRLVPSGWSAFVQPVAWLGPLLVAVLAQVWLNRRYRPRPIARAEPLAHARGERGARGVARLESGQLRAGQLSEARRPVAGLPSGKS